MVDEIILCVGPAAKYVRAAWARELDEALLLRESIFDKVVSVSHAAWLAMAKEAEEFTGTESAIPNLADLPLLICEGAQLERARVWLSGRPEVVLNIVSAEAIFELAGKIIRAHADRGITTEPAVRAMMFISGAPSTEIPVCAWIVPEMLSVRNRRPN